MLFYSAGPALSLSPSVTKVGDLVLRYMGVGTINPEVGPGYWRRSIESPWRDLWRTGAEPGGSEYPVFHQLGGTALIRLDPHGVLGLAISGSLSDDHCLSQSSECQDKTQQERSEN